MILGISGVLEDELRLGRSGVLQNDLMACVWSQRYGIYFRSVRELELFFQDHWDSCGNSNNMLAWVRFFFVGNDLYLMTLADFPLVC